VNNVLHFRLFDADGKMVVDTDEKASSAESVGAFRLGKPTKVV
jgi:hypothetical protein